MAPGTAQGFFWALGGQSINYLVLSWLILFGLERRELHRFSADLAKLAIRIADRHGSSGEKWLVTLCFAPSGETRYITAVGHKYFSVQWCPDLTTSTYEQIFLAWNKQSSTGTVLAIGVSYHFPWPTLVFG